MISFDFINALFAKFTLRYQDKWASKISPHSSGDNPSDYELMSSDWYEELRELNPEQINHGLKKCWIKFKSWPPTCMEFKELCLPTAEDLGAPDKVEAYLLAIKNNLENPFVYETISKITQYSFQRMNEREQKIRFYETYDSIIEKAKKTGVVPVKPKELPAPEQTRRLTTWVDVWMEKGTEVAATIHSLNKSLSFFERSSLLPIFEFYAQFYFHFLTKFERLNLIHYILTQEHQK